MVIWTEPDCIAIASGSDTDTLFISHADHADATRYRCRVANASSCPISNPAFSSPAALGLCRADFNCSGAANVGDLSSFLHDWFIGCSGADGSPCFGSNTDFNYSGSITVQDIFDFLHAYFAGCG